MVSRASNTFSSVMPLLLTASTNFLRSRWSWIVSVPVMVIAALIHSSRKPHPIIIYQAVSFFLVRAAFFAALERITGPLVLAAFFAEAERSLAVRCFAAARA